MAFNSLESGLLDAQRENYIGLLKGSIPLADNGWSTYLNTPVGISPSSGLGGVALSGLSLDTISPMSGDSDLRFAKDASNRQGEGFGYSFSINRSHLGRVLQISFDAELISGNYESPIPVPVTGTYSISSTTCTITATHSFVQGQYVYLTFTSGTVAPNGYYTITSVTATTFVVTVTSGSGTGNCTYSAIGDLRVFIIQDPTGTPVVIEPVNVNLQLGIVNQRIRHIATFQTHISITSYRLCIHVGSASTVAYTVDLANFKVWEQQQSLGAVITDWQSYTPAFTGFASISFVNTRWRRSGSNLEVEGDFFSGSADAGGTQHRIYFPSGLTAQSNLSRSAYRYLAGRLERDAVGNSNIGVMADGNRNYFTFGSFDSAANPFAELTTSTFGVSGYQFRIKASVPIAGWGSSVAMSSDSGDGRVVTAKYRGLIVQSYTANTTPIRWDTVVYDTHNAVTTGSGWKFTAPILGQYRVSFTYLYQATDSSNIGVTLWINGDNTRTERLTDINNQIGSSASTTIFLRAGEYFDLRLNTTKSLNTDNGTISIERISAGSQVIATQETVACSVNKTSGTATTPNRIASWNTKDLDTHGSFDLTNGTFTVPSSGIYLINASAVSLGNFTTYNQPGFTIRNGTTILSASTMYFTSSFEPELSTSALRRFIAGDIISLYGYGSGFACNNLIMNISRIGI